MRSSELKIGNYLGYEVRSDGVIISKRTNQPLVYGVNDKGYPVVGLSIDGKSYFRRVHRILAEVFIPNPENKPCVNHIDRDRANYSLDNLEWCTHSENVIHSVENGGRENWTRNNTGKNNPNVKLTWLIVSAIRDLYDTGKYSQNQLGEIFNLGQGRISKIINNKIWQFEELELK